MNSIVEVETNGRATGLVPNLEGAVRAPVSADGGLPANELRAFLEGKNYSAYQLLGARPTTR
ncbi:MAG TPA: hypothetical protein VF988_06800, partial [Verrucomicrobiae bacterium]